MNETYCKIDIDWNKTFELGHVRIDAEHRAFFDIIKSVDLELRAGHDVMRVLRLLNELRLYTEFHFVSEENIMEDAHYPDIADHRNLHKALLEELYVLIHDIQNGVDRFHELVPFLFDWFCAHTLSVDGKFTAFATALTPRD